MTAQVAHHHVQGKVGADGDCVRVHQAASGVVRVEHHLFDACPVLVVHGLQDLEGHPVGQLLQDVGDIVVIQALGELGDRLRIHFPEELALQVLAELIEHLAFQIVVQHLPEHVAVLGR